MGDVKDNMKPKSDGAKSVFGRFSKKKDKDPATEQNFADIVYDAHTSLAKLIAVKQSELSSEKGREEYNRKALSLLKTMNFHIEEVMTLGGEYANS